MIQQSACSELLVPTDIDDPEQAAIHYAQLATENNWTTEPQITTATMTALKEGSLGWGIRINGNDSYIKLSYNEVDHFHLYSDCWDAKSYPVVKAVIEHFKSVPYCPDGGSTNEYEDWLEKQDA